MEANVQYDFDKYGINENDFATEMTDIEKHFKETEEYKGMFIVRSANDWIEQAKKRPIPKMLFDKFWFEGELCILFADTNLGKSILAVQIANSVSEGEEITGFQMEAKKQLILYFDFELSDKQFEPRYSLNFNNHYSFDEKFLRIEINPDATFSENLTFEEYLNYSLEKSISETGAKVLIIDNITYLKSETEKAKDALPLMKYLKSLKTKYNLSILVLAHTPKRDLTKPLTKNDLQGSKMLINFCDSSFAIGESQRDKNVRYLKQIKQRNTELVYDSDNVCVCQIEKPQNFLQFSFLDFGTEREHLKQLSEMEKENVINKVKELSRQGYSQRQISVEAGISLGAVNKYLRK